MRRRSGLRVAVNRAARGRGGAVSGQIGYHPKLVEEAVRAALLTRPAEARIFDRERERLYEEPAGEQRERLADELHDEWFHHLSLDAPVALALEERPEIASGVTRIVVGPAASARDEGAELYVVAGTSEGSVVLALRP